jgi:hypothetical protein
VWIEVKYKANEGTKKIKIIAVMDMKNVRFAQFKARSRMQSILTHYKRES